MDKFEPSDPVQDILNTPDCTELYGAKPVRLTDSTGFREALSRSKNPNKEQVEVYEWHSTKLPESERMPMSRVRDIVVSLLQDVEENKNNPEVATMTMDQFRAWLLGQNEAYVEFFQKHPRMFRMIVGSNNTPQNVAHLLNIIEIRQSDMPEAQKFEHAKRYYQTHFMRKAREGEEEAAVKSGKGYKGTPMSAEEVKHDIASPSS